MSEIERRVSRRELLKQAALTGTAVAAASVAPEAARAVVSNGVLQTTTGAREAFETLTAAESDTLEAIAARLIPTDASGPGAAEARAAHYIDRALGGPLASSRDAYTAGLAALDAYAERTKGAPFAKLSPADQDAVLIDLERNVATGFTPSASAFFNIVRGHTIEGTFSDPYYGGNADFAGWDLIGYPGVRLMVTPEEQKLGTRVTPNHRSAYDWPMFSKTRGH